MGEADKERKQTFKNLELECTKLQKKVGPFFIDSMHLLLVGVDIILHTFYMLEMPSHYVTVLIVETTSHYMCHK